MAARFQRPPSAFLPTGKEWGPRDHLLVFAHQIYLDTKCGQCGRSVHVCRNEANLGQFEALTTSCQATAAIDERTGQQGYKREPGELLYAAPIDDDLVTGSGLVFAPDAYANQKRDESGEGN